MRLLSMVQYLRVNGRESVEGGLYGPRGCAMIALSYLGGVRSMELFYDVEPSIDKPRTYVFYFRAYRTGCPSHLFMGRIACGSAGASKGLDLRG